MAGLEHIRRRRLTARSRSHHRGPSDVRACARTPLLRALATPVRQSAGPLRSPAHQRVHGRRPPLPPRCRHRHRRRRHRSRRQDAAHAHDGLPHCSPDALCHRAALLNYRVLFSELRLPTGPDDPLFITKVQSSVGPRFVPLTDRHFIGRVRGITPSGAAVLRPWCSPASIATHPSATAAGSRTRTWVHRCRSPG